MPGTVLVPNEQVSVDDAPGHWVEAEREAPSPVVGLPFRPGRSRIAAIPVRSEGSFVANTVGAASGFIAGSIWYSLDLLGLYEGPWAPVAVAACIALSIRLFSRALPRERSVASIVTYLLVLLIVLILTTHRDLVAIYGEIGDYRAYEQSVVRSRLQDPLHLVAYGLGGLVAAVVPVVGRRR